MPLIDVSEIFGDPDFFDTYQFYRFTRTVDNHGRTRDTPQQFSMVACIQPAGPSQIQFLPEALRATQSITIWTQTHLVELSDTTAGDIVMYRGKPYRVQQTSDWSEFGQGYTNAIAVLTKMAADGP